MAGSSIICPKNKTVDVINDFVMDKFPGHSRKYTDNWTASTLMLICILLTTEFQNSLSPSGMPPHKIGLKVGCPVTLLRKLDSQHGHCKDTKCIVYPSAGLCH